MRKTRHGTRFRHSLSCSSGRLPFKACICVKISDICGEMNPLVFSALEEVNLVFIVMMNSTVMVDIVFARFIGDDETQQRYTFRLL